MSDIQSTNGTRRQHKARWLLCGVALVVIVVWYAVHIGGAFEAAAGSRQYDIHNLSTLSIPLLAERSDDPGGLYIVSGDDLRGASTFGGIRIDLQSGTQSATSLDIPSPGTVTYVPAVPSDGLVTVSFSGLNIPRPMFGLPLGPFGGRSGFYMVGAYTGRATINWHQGGQTIALVATSYFNGMQLPTVEQTVFHNPSKTTIVALEPHGDAWRAWIWYMTK